MLPAAAATLRPVATEPEANTVTFLNHMWPTCPSPTTKRHTAAMLLGKTLATAAASEGSPEGLINTASGHESWYSINHGEEEKVPWTDDAHQGVGVYLLRDTNEGRS